MHAHTGVKQMTRNVGNVGKYMFCILLPGSTKPFKKNKMNISMSTGHSSTLVEDSNTEKLPVN